MDFAGTNVTSSSSVFVIEDNDEMRTALARTLSGFGYRVRASESGRAALDELASTDVPDLFVLDLMMPVMNGWEFRVAQRSSPRLADVPVIVLTANRSAEARAIDADAYLAKPFDAKSLKLAVEKALFAAERRNFEKRAAEVDRLSALGLLAAGIAHEVNNPLAVLSGNMELAMKLLTHVLAQPTEPSRTALRRVEELLANASCGAARVAAVVRTVSTFAHPHDACARVVNVGDVLAASIPLVSNEIRNRAKLVCDVDAPLRTMSNPAQLGQVFINILIYVAHAIPEGGGERHRIRVEGRRSAEGRAVVEISANGPGIAAADLARLFDPFFTTKGMTRGSGLGLTISRRLVESWGGNISVKSPEGEGIRFRIELPGYDAPASGARSEPPPKSAEKARDESATSQRRIRLMVIDDESLICELVVGMLGDLVDAVTFTSPREALAALQSDPEFDVVLTDLMMPELSGMDLYETIEREIPALARRMVFMTGGTFTPRMQSFLERLDASPLLKPFSLDEVLAHIKEKMASSAQVVRPA